jgi:hypothetical protein
MSLLTYLDLLTEAECLKVRSQIYELRNLWEQLEPTLPFFILGSPIYKSGKINDLTFYNHKVQLFNPIMSEHFGWLYQRLSHALAEEFGEPICYKKTLALPGFHILIWHDDYKLHPTWGVGSPAHCDHQYKLLDSDILKEINLDQVITFTLAITMANNNCGLDIWDLHATEVSGLSQIEVNKFLNSRKKTFYPYQAGQLAIQSGLYFHRVPPFQIIQPDDERITLQGHCFFSQGTWHIYW